MASGAWAAEKASGLPNHRRPLIQNRRRTSKMVDCPPAMNEARPRAIKNHAARRDDRQAINRGASYRPFKPEA